MAARAAAWPRLAPHTNPCRLLALAPNWMQRIPLFSALSEVAGYGTRNYPHTGTGKVAWPFRGRDTKRHAN